jgi:uncharacterized protein YukE
MASNPLVDPNSRFNPDDYNSLHNGPITSGPGSSGTPAFGTTTGGNWLAGTGPWDDAQTLANDIASGKASGMTQALDFVAVGLDVIGAVIDPIGTFTGMLAGWLMEHLKPLKLILDELAGNPDTISGVANTWGNISSAMKAAANDYTAAVNGQTTGWQGGAADAYRGKTAGKLVHAMTSTSALSDAMKQIITVCGEVVATIRATVRDIISMLVGMLVSAIIEEACSLGLATPVVVAQALAKIGKATEETVKVIKEGVTVAGYVLALEQKIVLVFQEIVKIIPNLQSIGQDIPAAARA